eukprot:1134776-Pelagomonas_calceolata.AAC.2
MRQRHRGFKSKLLRLVHRNLRRSAGEEASKRICFEVHSGAAPEVSSAAPIGSIEAKIKECSPRGRVDTPRLIRAA